MQYTFDSSLVHKTSPDQVLLVSAEPAAGGALSLDVAVPPGHPLANTVPANSTLLGVELMRQCAIAFAHLAAGVPPGWAFLMNELTFSWHGESIPDNAGQFAGRVDVRLRNVKMRKGQVSDLQLEADYVSGGVVVGSGCGDLSCLPPRTYQAIRRNAPKAALESTGLLGAVLADVRRAAGALDGLLVWNQGDRFIFDHHSDHVSGMLFASAVLNAHLLLSGSQSLDFSLRCENFAEYNEPLQVSGTLVEPGKTLTTLTQSGRTIASGLCGGPREADAGQFHRQLSPAP
jgi:hypothetical protein